MVCLYCGSGTQVVNSRLQKRTNHIWRRRKCSSCSALFTTTEHAELSNALMVRTLDGKLQPFSRDHLFLSIYESCRHRALAVTDATALTLIVIGNLLEEARRGVLMRSTIAHTVHTALGRFDSVAATYYGAYHSVEG